MKTLLNKLALIALLSLALPTFGHAETKKKTEEPAKTEEKPKKDTYPLYGEVVSATDTLLTIKGGKDKPDRKYDITKDTKIHDGDKPATIKDIKAGAWVGGLLKKKPAGAKATANDDAVSINVGVKQKGEKADAPAETPKKKKTTS